MRTLHLLFSITPLALMLACQPRLINVGVDETSDTGEGPTSESGGETEDGTGETSGETGQGVCGDGFVDPGEACDLGLDNHDLGDCTTACELAACGDGLLHAGVEECDDGNTIDDDTCSNTCEEAECGDGLVQTGEECDDGNAIDDDACSNTCEDAECGDGIVQAGEECDDGNSYDHDSCLSTCVSATCGDGIAKNFGEQCDDGNAVDDDGCANDCSYNLDPMCAGPFGVLDDDTRSLQFADGPGGIQRCDRSDAQNVSPDWDGPGWYRAGPSDLHYLSMSPPREDYSCGGTAGGWVGDWITPEDGLVILDLCFALGGDDCAWSIEVPAISCYHFTLYELPDAPDCDLRYCTGMIIPP